MFEVIGLLIIGAVMGVSLASCYFVFHLSRIGLYVPYVAHRRNYVAQFNVSMDFQKLTTKEWANLEEDMELQEWVRKTFPDKNIEKSDCGIKR